MTTSPLRRTQITVVERIRGCFDPMELLPEAIEKPPETGIQQAGTPSKMQV
jgi:hypothetical protein